MSIQKSINFSVIGMWTTATITRAAKSTIRKTRGGVST